VFLSTNLVFDGLRPLREPNEPLCPRAEYGRQKAEVEMALEEFADRRAVIRMTKVFHANMPLLRNWKSALASSSQVSAYSDLYCSPIPLLTLVSAIAEISERLHAGTWHLSGDQDFSYQQIATRLAKNWGYSPELIRPVPAPATIPIEHRPRFTTLSTVETRRGLGINLPSAGATIDQLQMT
jgi:dTDP-4-dehydrorhamnose reductase